MDTSSFIIINPKDIIAASKARSVIAKTARKYGQRNVQSLRFIHDSIVEIETLGGAKMNPNVRGYAASYGDGIPMENKNTHSEIKSNHKVFFQDVTQETLDDIAHGKIIISLSSWGTQPYPDWILVGSSEQVKEQLLKSYNPASKRPYCTASFQHCFEHGFKLVILGDKEEVVSALAQKYPELAEKFNFDDIICTKEEAKAFVATL